MSILITGGAGYIASHTVIELERSGLDVVLMDNLINSNKEVVNRLEKITNKTIPFYTVDCTDKTMLKKIFETHKIDSVIHFAGLKSVGESVTKPLLYYHNNLFSTIILCEVMHDYEVNKLVFSSSATVYGTPKKLPLSEESHTGDGITNPYGKSKYMIEQILSDVSVAKPELDITVLRYFNPVGADKSGLIGEDPNGTPNNLLPYISQVAVGHLDRVKVFGNDYKTIDGTGVRDYIHVTDLAKGHIAALNHLKRGINFYNLGTGKGTSVLELINTYSKTSNKKIPYVVARRRVGDVAECLADPSKANKELGWYAEKSIEEACADSWRWQKNNLTGYAID